MITETWSTTVCGVQVAKADLLSILTVRGHSYVASVLSFDEDLTDGSSIMVLFHEKSRKQITVNEKEISEIIILKG